MIEESIRFSWKSFQTHLTSAFRNLQSEESFADVTLVSDDQVQIPAHKIVLSACSPVLKNLLLMNPHPHPLLYLRGVKQQVAVYPTVYVPWGGHYLSRPD